MSSKSQDPTMTDQDTPQNNLQVTGTPVTAEVRAALQKAAARTSRNDPRNLAPGTRLAGRYEIRSKIGEGSMGAVYHALDTTVDDEIAIKVLVKQSADEALREAKLARKVTHPNICRIHDLGEVDRLHFISMEYISGETLKNCFNSDHPFTQSAAANIGLQICRGLEAIHEQEILHRDLKPDNLIITGDEKIKITDFGVAALAQHIHPREVVGALPYLAPELWDDPSRASIQSDVYALGLVLYHLFTGHQAFPETSIDEYRKLHRSELPPRPVTWNKKISHEVDSIIMRCIAKDPASRPATVSEVSSVLSEETKTHPTASVERTVVVVDLSRSNDLTNMAYALDPNEEAAARLNQQIKSLIDDALTAIHMPPEDVKRKKEGDGEIIVFKEAVAANRFAVELHHKSEEFSREAEVSNSASQHVGLYSVRCFRIGIASGHLLFTDDDLAGRVITRAVRLEGGCHTGEIVIDTSTWSRLPFSLRSGYGREEIVVGKREERFPAHRCRVVRPAPWERQDVILTCSIFNVMSYAKRLRNLPWARIIAQNNEIILNLSVVYGGREIWSKSGDHYALQFYRGWDAVRFALECRERIGKLITTPDAEADVRFAIDQIHTEEREQISPDPTGDALRLAGQIMECGDHGRILLTHAAFDRASRDAGEEETGSKLQWLRHGGYEIDREDEVIEICEVTDQADAPSERPSGTEKVRPVPPQSKTFEWLPTSGQEVPGSGGWKLEKKIGEGGFGEVWLAKKETEQSVFKFCSDERRIASLKREVSIFELMKETMGVREDITQILAWNFDKKPYYIQSAYAKHGNLMEWMERRRGYSDIPFEVRLKIAEQIAGALDAAHSFGVIHSDIKPSNVLVTRDDDRPCPHIQLADFGLGKISGKLYRDRINQVKSSGEAGLFASLVTSATSTWTYSAPEVLEGRQETTEASDVYALGVLLFQMAVDDFSRTLLPHWQKGVTNKLFLEDISKMLARSPEDRPTIDEVATKLRDFKSRETEWQRRRAERASRVAEKERRAKRRIRNWMIASLVFSFLAVCATGLFFWKFDAERQALDHVEQALGFIVDSFKIADPADISDPGQPRGAKVTARELLDLTARRLETELSDHPEVRVPVVNAVGDIYRNLGLVDQAEPWIEEALDLRRKTFGEGSLDFAESLHSKGMLKGERSQFAEAKALFNDALAIRRDQLPDESPKVVESLESLAQALAATGEYETAEEHAREALAIRRRIFEREQTGVAHVEVASSLNDLAMVLWLKGNYEEVETVLREALEIQRSTLGNHPHTAFTMSNLGLLLLDFKGDFAESGLIWRQTLEMQQDIYGDDHPEVAKSLSNLGKYYFQKGEYGKAEKYYRQAMEMLARIFGDEHLGIAVTLINLAQVNEARGEYEVADERYRRALSMQRHLLGDGNDTVARTMTERARVAARMARYDEALTLYEQALAIQRRILGNDSAAVAATLDGQAGLFDVLGRMPDAESAYREALVIQEQVFGAESLEVAATGSRLAGVLSTTGRLSEAMALYRSALGVVERTFGKDHLYVADIEKGIALILVEREQDVEQASTLLAEVLATYRAAIGETNPDVATALTNVGYAHEKRGEYDAARRCYEESLAMRRELLGDANPSVASVLGNLARLMLLRGDSRRCEEHIEEALRILTAATPDHWRTAYARSIRGGCLTGLGRYAEAEGLLRRSDPILRERTGDGSRYTRETLHRLVRLYEVWPGRSAEAEPYRLRLRDAN